MLVNLTTPLSKIDGTTFKKEGSDKDVADVRYIAVKTVLAEFPEEKLNGEQKFKRYELAQALTSAGDTIDLKVEDVAIIKAGAAKGYPIEVYGALINAIDPKVVPVKQGE